MSRQDRQIDYVLNALRTAEPRAGLEDRILARIRTVQPGNELLTRWQIAGLPFGAPMPWLAAATLLAVTAGTLLLQHRTRAHGNSRDAKTSASVLPGPHLRSEAWGTPGVHSSPSQRVPHVSLLRHGFQLVRSTQADSFPAKDTESFPPPPLPLTEQERLMLQMTRHEPLQQLANLSKPAQDAAFQHDKDSVTEFFAPAPPLDQESSSDDLSTGQQ